MERALKIMKAKIYHMVNGERKSGPPSGIRGDLSDISGDLSDISGNLDDCKITDADRAKGVIVSDLVQK